jgi:hypothetical protein
MAHALTLRILLFISLTILAAIVFGAPYAAITNDASTSSFVKSTGRVAPVTFDGNYLY